MHMQCRSADRASKPPPNQSINQSKDPPRGACAVVARTSTTARLRISGKRKFWMAPLGWWLVRQPCAFMSVVDQPRLIGAD